MWNYSEDMLFVLAFSSLISSMYPRSRHHCSYQTTKPPLILLHHKHAYILVRACLCLGTYTFTLDTDSLETLGFNPRTPTLRLRPMTSRLIEYRCSLPRPFRIPIVESQTSTLDFSIETVRQWSRLSKRKNLGRLKIKWSVTERRAIAVAYTHATK